MSRDANDERFKAMFRKALILPICAMGLLAASQFASAQAIQPANPCPPGKTAQNYNRGTESGSQTAQNYNRGTEGAQVAQNYDRGTGGNAQVAQNFNRGTSAPVVGRPVDVVDCR
jgi:hypothetical protein